MGETSTKILSEQGEVTEVETGLGDRTTVDLLDPKERVRYYY